MTMTKAQCAWEAIEAYAHTEWMRGSGIPGSKDASDKAKSLALGAFKEAIAEATIEGIRNAESARKNMDARLSDIRAETGAKL